jgi:hypothetical protein
VHTHVKKKGGGGGGQLAVQLNTKVLGRKRGESCKHKRVKVVIVAAAETAAVVVVAALIVVGGSLSRWWSIVARV